MAENTLKKLSLSLDKEEESDGAWYIYESFQNGNIKDSREMFQALLPNEQARCIEYLHIIEWRGNRDGLFEAVISWLKSTD